MAHRWYCKKGNTCADTRVCPCCGEIGPKSISASEQLAISDADSKRLARYVVELRSANKLTASQFARLCGFATRVRELETALSEERALIREWALLNKGASE